VTAIVGKDTAIGTQFHPEKSQRFRPGPDLELSEVEAVILFPCRRPEKRPVRAPRTGRHGARDRVQPRSRAQARSFAEQGFEYLHVVDLDGAFAGKPMNALAVEAMLKAVTMPVQLGGGIRDLKTVEAWLDKGIARVIIGTGRGARSGAGEERREKISRPRRGWPRRPRRQGCGRKAGPRPRR
jgi:hypothetical protein